MNNNDYFIGLDMGTSSVGWAVTDESYKLLRAKGKDLWGVRLFPEASTAEGRRTNRIARRRLARRNARISYVKEIFHDEINKVDPGFYQRLADSKFFEEDKTEKQPFALFAGSGYTDQDYYKQYPTIFHLRNELIHSSEEHDVRLVYLAVLNIFKHRGHFLNASLDSENGDSIEALSLEFRQRLMEYAEYEIQGDLSKVLKTYISSKDYSSSKKHEEILKALDISKTKDKQVSELIKMICGLKGKLAVAFSNDELDEEHAKDSISFRDGNFDEAVVAVEEILSEESFELLMLLKQIHDWGVLADLMQGRDKTYKYLSEARIAQYEKHKADLAVLKKLFKENLGKEEYEQMFRVMDKDNYSAYVGSVNSGSRKERRGASTNRENFYKNVKKYVDKMPDSEEKEYVLEEMAKESFLPKQLTASNGVIPNQLHVAELKAILDNAKGYLPFLVEKDETGLTTSEKLIQVFSFNIPYYIGPLKNTEDNNAWVVRKKAGKVFKWNFNEMIDEKASAEKFIENMVKQCTYLSDENVLPKNSLLYEKFMVLNELNNLKINGIPVSVELKQKLYNDLFRKGKKVKATTLVAYLKSNGLVSNTEEVAISGIDTDFTNTLSNYAKFTSILDTDVLTDSEKKMAEDIIFWSTVYGDSKKFLEEKIKEVYGDILDDKQIKRILGIKFKDWGRLSKSFLELEGANKDTEEKVTIINRMWNENYNLMQLLSDDFTYVEEVEKRAGKAKKSILELTYDDLDGMYLSAPVKRMIWQTILILREIYRVMGRMPKKIFVEMAKPKGVKGERKDSRKKKFEDLYKGNKEFLSVIKETEESKFRSKKLYLYYTQQGRCMYTGESIELHDLFNDNLYDIDHIYPRHFVKDDSIENNLVLVKKQVNAHKSDVFPLEGEVRSSRASFWKVLKEGGFITAEKYNRLTRSYGFTDEEKAAFISRQIVETQQGTKVIAELLKNAFDNIEVVYSKASVVSDFRKKFDLIKCRDVNDFHHANDAYLNIVVGNAYNVKFTRNPLNFIKEYNRDKEKYRYNMDKIFDYDIVRGENVGWRKSDNGSIKTVKAMMAKNTPLISRMSYEAHGELYDLQLKKAKDARKKDGEGYLPIKSNDERLKNVGRYGGYGSLKGAFFFLVEHTQKKKRVRTIEAMPRYLAAATTTEKDLEKYCTDKLGYVEPSIRLKRINTYSTIRIDGFYLYLTGRSANQLTTLSATSLIVSYQFNKYVKAIVKSSESEMLDDVISTERNIALYDELLRKYTGSLFSKRPNPMGKILENGREAFGKLNVQQQMEVLLNILQLNVINTGVDLTLIGGKKQSGTLKISNNITGKNFKLINRSVTGIFEEEIDLLTI